ncbi:ribonuclease HII [Candidatus Methylacidithermus pantelleriae]|nr:ribonuclease HII [Candidatus Methylacidithermus pantelleriae]
MKANLVFEKRLIQLGYRWVAGVDEAGRGPWAGPVVAAAVMLPLGFTHPDLDDSKRVAPQKRLVVAEILRTSPSVYHGLGLATVAEIDCMGIVKATLIAMERAVRALPVRPDFLLVDGSSVPCLGLPALALVKGDARSASIAAASILAKVRRDIIMEVFDKEYPQYGFARHKGYGTLEHRKALEIWGPCSIHRRSFLPVVGLS